MLLGKLGAGLLVNVLAGWGIYRAGKGVIVMRKGRGKRINRAREGFVRSGHGRPSSSASQNDKIDF